MPAAVSHPAPVFRSGCCVVPGISVSVSLIAGSRSSTWFRTSGRHAVRPRFALRGIPPDGRGDQGPGRRIPLPPPEAQQGNQETGNQFIPASRTSSRRGGLPFWVAWMGNNPRQMRFQLGIAGDEFWVYCSGRGGGQQFTYTTPGSCPGQRRMSGVPCSSFS